MSEGRAVVLAQASRSCVDWCWSVDCASACVCVCVWVRASYWQEVQLLTEGLVRARVQASALTDNFPLRGSAHSGDTLRPRPLCLDVSPLLYLTARLYSQCNLIKSYVHLRRPSEDLSHFNFIWLHGCFPLSQCISLTLFLSTFKYRLKIHITKEMFPFWGGRKSIKWQKCNGHWCTNSLI